METPAPILYDEFSSETLVSSHESEDVLSFTKGDMEKDLKQIETDNTANTSTWEHEDLAKVKIRVIRCHSDSVNSCAFFCNDTKILSASSDRSLKICDANLCQVLREYPEVHSDKINKACITKDGSKIVSVGWDRRVILKNTETGQNLMTGEHVGIVLCCAISNDNRTIVSCSDLDNTVKLWDIRSRQLIEQVEDIHSSTLLCVTFTPDNNRVVTSSTDRLAKIWDIRSKNVVLTLIGHTNPVHCCAVSPDGHTVATASWDKSVKLWDVQTGVFRTQGPRTLVKGHDGSVSSCKFTKDNVELVSAGYDKHIIVWDIKHNVEKLKLQGHTDWIEDIDVSEEREWIVSASKDNTVRLWHLGEMETVRYVQESSRKAIGLKIIQCVRCGKPFPISQLQNDSVESICVFCRLDQNPNVPQPPQLT